MTTFDATLAQHFPGAMDEDDFVRWTLDTAGQLGFSPDNSIACVGVCRDELCRSLVWAVREIWGEAFNFSSLGGNLTLGTAGFIAAHRHAPVVDGRERYVYIVMPHIGIGAGGEVGQCVRAGRHGSSVACGALHGILDEVRGDGLDLELDPDNLEYSLLKRALAPWLATQTAPDVAAITLATVGVIHEELERMIELTVDPSSADYVVFTGVQIHRPQEGTMVWPFRSHACIAGVRHRIEAR